MSNNHAAGQSLRLNSLLRKRAAVTGGQHRKANNAANQALMALIRKETLSGLASFFGGARKRPVSPDSGSLDEPLSSAGGTRIDRRAPTTGDPRGGGFDQRQMELSIDQMVAAALTQGRQTSVVLRTLFGLVPSLIGR